MGPPPHGRWNGQADEVDGSRNEQDRQRIAVVANPLRGVVWGGEQEAEDGLQKGNEKR